MKQNKYLWLLALIVLPVILIWGGSKLFNDVTDYSNKKQLKAVNAKCDSLQVVCDSLVEHCQWADSAYLETALQLDHKIAKRYKKGAY